MAKLTRFQRSLNAHERLVNFHEKNNNRRLSSYHVEVYNKQLNRGSILSRRERRKIYNGWVKSR